MIKINGTTYDAEEMSLMEYLQNNNYKMNRIAIECNEEIVPKSQYESFIIHSGDVIEIVTLVGGG